MTRWIDDLFNIWPTNLRFKSTRSRYLWSFLPICVPRLSTAQNPIGASETVYWWATWTFVLLFNRSTVPGIFYLNLRQGHRLPISNFLTKGPFVKNKLGCCNLVLLKTISRSITAHASWPRHDRTTNFRRTSASTRTTTTTASMTAAKSLSTASTKTTKGTIL